MAYKYAGKWNTTIASIAGGTGITSFTVTSASGAPTLAAGDFTTALIADGTGSVEEIVITGLSGTTVTCIATTIAHANGDAFAGDILTKGALDQFKEDAISGYPENALSAAGALVHGTGVTNRITLTSADATFTLANGTYKGELCRVVVDRTSTKLVTIDPAGGTTIDGATTRVMWAGETCLLAWTGTEWEKRAGKTIPMQCTMHLSANQTGVVTATITKVAVNTITGDNTGRMGNSGSTRIDIKRSGTYLVLGKTANSLTSSSERNSTLLYQSGAQVGAAEVPAAGFSFAMIPAPTAIAPASIAWVAGDYAELYGFQNSGGNQAFYGAAALSGGPSYLSVIEQPTW